MLTSRLFVGETLDERHATRPVFNTPAEGRVERNQPIQQHGRNGFVLEVACTPKRLGHRRGVCAAAFDKRPNAIQILKRHLEFECARALGTRARNEIRFAPMDHPLLNVCLTLSRP